MIDANLDERFTLARDEYRAAMELVYEACPEFHGKMFTPIAGGPFNGYVPMSFSHTLIDIAGGIHNLIEYWSHE